MPSRNANARQDDLPFMQQLGDAFVSHQSNQFLLTGNVLDLLRCPWEKSQSDDARPYLTLSDYLCHRLTVRDRLVITYNIARGIEFASPEDKQRAAAIYLGLFSAKDMKEGRRSFDETVANSPAYVLASLTLLRKICKAAALAPSGPPVAIIIEYADSVVPNNAITQMGDHDRQRLIFLKEWLTDSGFVDSSNLLIMIAETSSSVHGSIRSLPHVVSINLPLPDLHERRLFIRWLVRQYPDLKLKGSQTSFAQLSAGMSLLGIEQTMRLARYKKGKLEASDFLYYLNRLLVNHIGDYIEIIKPAHTLKDVIGATTLKRQLKRVSQAMQASDPSVSPVGLLVAGPNGVGKTFIFTAWAGETDRIVLVLKNLRGQFFGQTDQIFEKIRNVLEVLGNVIVLIDEADTMFGKPGSNTHETEQRLFGNLVKMMGNPANRGKIVWVLMTARPDNLAPDLKRSGRCGLHLPVFDPESDDREAFLSFVLKQAGFDLRTFSKEERQRFDQLTGSLSPVDFRELSAEFKAEALISKKPLTPEACLHVLADFMPADIGSQRRFQTLQALLHCSRQSLIPPSLAALDRSDVQASIQRLST